MLKCDLCGFETLEPKLFSNHYLLNHHIGRHFRFTCGVPGCNSVFTCAKRFEKHYVDFHKNVSVASTLTSTVNDDESLTTNEEIVFRCDSLGCPFETTNSSTFRSHAFRNHRHKEPSLSSVQQSASSTTGSGSSSFIVPDINPPTNNPPSNHFSPSEEDSLFTVSDSAEDKSVHVKDYEEEILKNFVHLYLTLHAKYLVPETTLQFLVNKFHILLKESRSHLEEQLVKELELKGVDTSIAREAVQKVAAKDIAVKIHSHKGPLRSAHLRKQQYAMLFPCVQPVGYSLKFNDMDIESKHHYVSIEESLTALFSDDSVYSQYLERRHRVSDLNRLTDIQDGLLYKSNQHVGGSAGAIELLAFQDDLETRSALGSERLVHKINGFYFTLGNLHPWNRSRIDPYQLAMLTREKDVSYFGWPRCLEPMIKELKKLETEGMEIRGERVKVILLLLKGDNLGSNSVGGFLENFSAAHYFCRFCEEPRCDWLARWYPMKSFGSNESGEVSEEESEEESSDEENRHGESEEVSGDEEECIDGELEEESEEVSTGNGGEEATEDEEVATVLMDCNPLIASDWSWLRNNISGDENTNLVEPSTVSKAPLRTKESYMNCVEALPENPGGVKGVVANSVFNELDTFHVAEALPVCLAHDIFEGVVNYDVYLIIDYFEKKYKVSKDFINSKFKSFPFKGEDRRDKPAKIPLKGQRLGGHAVQNWVLLRFLPKILAIKITNKDDPVWVMLILLVEIVQIICCQSINPAILPLLEVKIHAYLRARVSLFPAKLRPKHHFLEHYPIFIRRYGPLMRVWTLRDESKHTYFKNVTRAARNLRNITSTLSQRHQLLQSAMSANKLFNDDFIMEDGKSFESFICSHQTSKSIKDTFGEELLPKLLFSNKAEWHGTQYQKGQYVVLSVLAHESLIVAKIALMIRSSSCLYIAGSKATAKLNIISQVFETEDLSVDVVERVTNLADFLPFPEYTVVGGPSFLVPKHYFH